MLKSLNNNLKKLYKLSGYIAAIFLIFVAADLYQEPTEKFSFTEINPYKWCFILLLLGLADKILTSLYTCILSALIISQFNSLAMSRASLDFPDAVGPNKSIIFFDKLFIL